MKRLILMTVASLCAAAIALAAPGPQAGPTQKDTAKRDSTKAEAKAPPAKKAPAKPAKEAPAKPAKKAPAKPAKKTTKTEGGTARTQGATRADSTHKAPPKKAPAQKAQPPKRESVQAQSQPSMRPVGTPASGHIKRAVFTTGIQDHEPVDTVDSLKAPADKIYFFTEIVGMPGQTVTHRWMYGGDVKAEVPIAVRSPRWRAYSSKDLLPGWSGEWTVQVVDSTGAVLDTSHFVYTSAGPTNRGGE